MTTHEPFMPQAVFAVEEAESPSVPRVLVAPNRYIQGPGVLDHIGRYLSLLPSRRAAILISEGGERRLGERLWTSLKRAGVDLAIVTFGGECTPAEADRIAAAVDGMQASVDALIAVGGGKTLDTGKCAAERLSIPVVSCPTIASTDAPCSAVSVMYAEDGTFAGVEFFPSNPAIVVVDTEVIAGSPVQYLVAGMGDALSTHYEARTCFRNPAARSVVGGRITAAAAAIGELCASTVFEHGPGAAAAVRRGEVTEALELVVEANTLLSGVGFESGGLAAAHAIASSLPFLPRVHAQHLHGEMVAIGLLTQLVLEGDSDEARRVAEFMASIGLPVHLGQLSLDPEADADALREMTAVAAGIWIAHNEPFEVTPESLLAALLEAHRLGAEVAGEVGDAAWRELTAR